MSIIYCKNSKILGKRVCTTAIFSFMSAFIALKGRSFQNLFNALNGSQVSIVKINSERMWFDPVNPNITPTYFFSSSEQILSNKFTIGVFWFLITKTCLYSYDPFKPQFYIVKLGFTGVFVLFLYFCSNIDCVYSLEPPRRGGSNEYPQSIFWAEIWKKYQSFLSEVNKFLEVKFSIYSVFE